MKRKIIVSSVLTILLCLSIIAGSTFALFTSRSDVNIAITAGKVELVATIDQASLKLYTQMTDDPTVNEYGPESVFENGGTATVNADGELVIERMTPADKVVFDVVMENNSDVNIQYRVTWATESKLAQVLDVYASEVDSAKDVTTWTEWKAPADNTQKYKRTTVTVHLPSEVGNDYQTAEAKIVISVEAVQGNGVTAVSDATGLADALAKAPAGSSLQLDAANFGTITLDGEINGVTLVAAPGTTVDQIIIAPTAKLTDVVLANFNTDTPATGNFSNGYVLINAGATVDNLVIRDSKFVRGASNTPAFSANEPTAVVTFENCVFEGCRAYYNADFFCASLTYEGCTFQNYADNWAIQGNEHQWTGDLTVNNCVFDKCQDGIAKIATGGILADGYTLTFTNNSLVDCIGHDGSAAKMFTINVGAGATAVVSGNTFNGADWAPTAADGFTY